MNGLGRIYVVGKWVAMSGEGRGSWIGERELCKRGIEEGPKGLFPTHSV